MARPCRDQPLHAAPRFTPVALEPRSWDGPDDGPVVAPPRPRTTGPSAPAEPRSRWRSVLVGTGIGFAVLLAGAGLAFSIVAIPLFFVASTEPGSGAHRDLVLKGLFYVALPFGAACGLVGGVVSGIWYGRGGRLPEHPR